MHAIKEPGIGPRTDKMYIRKAETLFRQGRLVTATVGPHDGKPNRFQITFKDIHGNKIPLMATRRDHVKIFRGQNGAIQEAQSIGFKEVIVTS